MVATTACRRVRLQRLQNLSCQSTQAISTLFPSSLKPTLSFYDITPHTQVPRNLSSIASYSTKVPVDDNNKVPVDNDWWSDYEPFSKERTSTFKSSEQNYDFGQNGHDYDFFSDAGFPRTTLSTSDIHGLIAKRCQARMSRNFVAADEIQSELKENDVYVHDGMKLWRSDGIPFDGAGVKRSNSPYPVIVYKKSSTSTDDERTNDLVIEDLIKERAQLRSVRDYERADSIRLRLQFKFGVAIDDKLKEWSVGGSFGEDMDRKRDVNNRMRNRDYIKSKHSAVLSPEREDFVKSKVEERAEAKRNRNYAVADDIRDKLYEELNVTINDNLKQWSVGGDLGIYSRYGGGNLSEDDIQTIHDFIRDRRVAKEKRDFESADNIQNILISRFNVVVDDKRKEWRVDTDDYTESQDSMARDSLTLEQIEYIKMKLVERLAFKTKRDYDAADAIRDELKFEYSVFINDRSKEWNYVPEQVNETPS